MILNETKDTVSEQVTGLLRAIELPWTMEGTFENDGNIPYFVTNFNSTKVEVYPQKVLLSCISDDCDGKAHADDMEVMKRITTSKGTTHTDSLLYRQLYKRFAEEKDVSFLQSVRSKLLGYQEDLEVRRIKQEEQVDEEDAHRTSARASVKKLQASIDSHIAANKRLLKEKAALERKITALKRTNNKEKPRRLRQLPFEGE